MGAGAWAVPGPNAAASGPLAGSPAQGGVLQNTYTMSA